MRYCAHPVRFCSFLSLGSCWFCRGGAASGEGAKTDPHGFAARSCALHPLSRLDRYTGYSFLQRKENRGACKKSSHYRRQARRDGCFNRLGIEEGLRKKKAQEGVQSINCTTHITSFKTSCVSLYCSQFSNIIAQTYCCFQISWSRFRTAILTEKLCRQLSCANELYPIK